MIISDEKFPKSERLLKTKEFSFVYKRGSCVRQGAISLYTLANSLTQNRMGISISSKRVKSAARRNRLKRVLRETYRRNRKYLKKGFDMVFVIKTDPGKFVSYKIVNEIFLKSIQKAGLRA